MSAFIKNIEKNTGKITFTHFLGASFTVVPSKGGIINELIFIFNDKKYSVIDGYSDSIDVSDGYKSALLLPFPNRTNKGKYNFNKVGYQLPINEDRMGSNGQEIQHALHGLVFNQEWKITNEEITEHTVSITISHVFNGISSYPFCFVTDVNYTFDVENNTLTTSTSVHNKSTTSIPIGLGFHPYFKINNTSVNDLTLKFDEVNHLLLDEYAIPTGERKEYSEFKKGKRMSDLELDDSYALKAQTNDSFVVSIANQEVSLAVTQETGNQKFNFLQLYTPPHRKSIAIEPMTCGVDALNTGDGLIELEPNTSFSATYTIQLLTN
ncbi:MAG: hypothetical protein AB8B61_00335 [Cyclobacteriaceae bacterium]